MNLHITAAYYSPTGGCRKTAVGLAAALAAPAKPAELDLSCPGGPAPREFGPDDLVVFTGPVFGGRLIRSMPDTLKALKGNGALAVAGAVYGNRAYEDAMVELADLLTAQGFRVIAGTALLAEHSLVRTVAAGRPDAQDLVCYDRFAADIRKKLEAGDFSLPDLPGNRPYKEWKQGAFVPAPTAGCTHCGLCAARCPVNAIDPDSVLTDPARCVICMRCVSECPEQARAIPEAVSQTMGQKLGPLAGIYKENELYL